MKLLLLEYITAGGLNREPLSTALLQEGAMMRDALLRDLADIATVEVITSYDARLPKPENVVQAIAIDANTDPEMIWRNLLKNCDAALVVAPETGGILTRLTTMIEAAGKLNLGCHKDAVQIASNKYATYEVLSKAGIPTITTHLANNITDLEDSSHGYVLKPRDGAGCEQTYFFHTKAELSGLLSNRPAGNFIIQPYQPGQAASISAIFKNGQAWLLSCNEQLIDISEQQIALTGCNVNALTAYQAQLHIITTQIAQAIPTLNGYAGIDVIITEDAIFVVEINPRITTSYIGLRESLNYNPASLIFDLGNQAVFTIPPISKNLVEIPLHA